ncbi:MAG: S8 family serine peptidase [Candidatus Promineifilaceae bacterium]
MKKRTLHVALLMFVATLFVTNAISWALSDTIEPELILISNNSELIEEIENVFNISIRVYSSRYQTNLTSTTQDIRLPEECPADQPVVHLDLRFLTPSDQSAVKESIASMIEYSDSESCLLSDPAYMRLLHFAEGEVIVTATESEISEIEAYVPVMLAVGAPISHTHSLLTKVYRVAEGLNPLDVSYTINRFSPGTASPNTFIMGQGDVIWGIANGGINFPTSMVASVTSPLYHPPFITSPSSQVMTPTGNGVALHHLDNMALPGTTPTYLGKSFNVRQYATSSTTALPEQNGMVLHGLLTSAELIERVPNADLTVHAVLDESGMGTIAHLAAALTNIVDSASTDKPIVVNGSLYLQAPDSGMGIDYKALHAINERLQAPSAPIVHFVWGAGNSAPNVVEPNHLREIFDNSTAVAGYTFGDYPDGSPYGPAHFSQSGDLADFSGGFRTPLPMGSNWLTTINNANHFKWHQVPSISGVIGSGYAPIDGTSIASPRVAASVVKAVEIERWKRVPYSSAEQIHQALVSTTYTDNVYNPVVNSMSSNPVLGAGIHCEPRFQQFVAYPTIPNDDCKPALETLSMPVDVQMGGPALHLGSVFTETDLPPTIQIPITFAPAQNNIASFTFSVDTHHCLTPIASNPLHATSLLDGFSVAFNLNERLIQVSVYDARPDQHTIENGIVAYLNYTTTCDIATDDLRYDAPIWFADAPPTSFGNTLGESIDGATSNGMVTIIKRYEQGDCNHDEGITSADLTSLTLEVFDGDGLYAVDASGGTFFGSPNGCDASADKIIDAGDAACLRLLNWGDTSCLTSRAVDQAGSTAQLTLADDVVIANQMIRVPVTLAPASNAVSAIYASIDYDETRLEYVATDTNLSKSTVTVTHDLLDQAGELDLTVLTETPSSSLPDETLLWLVFRPKVFYEEAYVRFSAELPPSAGSTIGHSVQITGQDASILITPVTSVQVQELQTARPAPQIWLLLFGFALVTLTVAYVRSRIY